LRRQESPGFPPHSAFFTADKLRDLGRDATGRWLDENLAAVGVPPTLDLARFAGRSWSCMPRTAARPEPPSGGPQEDGLAWRAAPGVI